MKKGQVILISFLLSLLIAPMVVADLGDSLGKFWQSITHVGQTYDSYKEGWHILFYFVVFYAIFWAGINQAGKKFQWPQNVQTSLAFVLTIGITVATNAYLSSSGNFTGQPFFILDFLGKLAPLILFTVIIIIIVFVFKKFDSTAKIPWPFIIAVSYIILYNLLQLMFPGFP